MQVCMHSKECDFKSVWTASVWHQADILMMSLTDGASGLNMFAVNHQRVCTLWHMTLFWLGQYTVQNGGRNITHVTHSTYCIYAESNMQMFSSFFSTLCTQTTWCVEYKHESQLPLRINFLEDWKPIFGLSISQMWLILRLYMLYMLTKRKEGHETWGRSLRAAALRIF